MLDSDIKADIMEYTGYTNEEDKSELIGLIILGISGIITILWSVFKFLWQVASADEQNTISREGQVYELLNTAIEHLGNRESDSARIASFNEFYHIAEIEPDRQKTIFDILFGHLRQTTKHGDYKNNLKPTKEVQSLLDILFKPKNKNIFSGLEANLAEVHLQGANLQEANLQNVNLRDANLQNANLQDAKMQDANLRDANLQDAHLQDANLQEANLQGANLQEANLRDANLQEANLREVNLRDANLQDANLQGANLQEANLQEANLQEANLQGVNLQEANLRYANLREANLRYANLQGTHLQRQYTKEEDLQRLDPQEAELQGADLLGAQINRETTVIPDNWKSVVKLYENEDGEKRPFVVVIDGQGNIEGRY